MNVGPVEEIVETTALDQDDFDQHECMGVVLHVIEHLHVKFGTNFRSEEMPDWMKSMHATFENAGKLVDLIPLKFPRREIEFLLGS